VSTIQVGPGALSAAAGPFRQAGQEAATCLAGVTAGASAFGPGSSAAGPYADMAAAWTNAMRSHGAALTAMGAMLDWAASTYQQTDQTVVPVVGAR
jgi:hypothetical protein